MTQAEILTVVQSRFPQHALQLSPLVMRGTEPGDQHFIRIDPKHLIDVLTFMRDDPRLRFDQLCDLTCVDYLHFPGAADRYGVVYSLLSVALNHRCWLKCLINDPSPAVPTVTGLWPGAEWLEREVFDMFGVRFDGHPDLRRILTWDGFKAHPLRKDYPLRGQGEREQYPVITRDSA